MREDTTPMQFATQIGEGIKRLKQLDKERREIEEKMGKHRVASVIQMSAGSFIVTLPIEWCRQQQVEKGSKVLIIQREGCLLITPMVK